MGYLYAISQNAEVIFVVLLKYIVFRFLISTVQMILDLDVMQDALTLEALDSQTLQTMDQFHCVDQISSPISQ